MDNYHLRALDSRSLLSRQSKTKLSRYTRQLTRPFLESISPSCTACRETSPSVWPLQRRGRLQLILPPIPSKLVGETRASRISRDDAKMMLFQTTSQEQQFAGGMVVVVNSTSSYIGRMQPSTWADPGRPLGRASRQMDRQISWPLGAGPPPRLSSISFRFGQLERVAVFR